MRNRLGLLLVIAYFAHSIASVAYAATLEDPKGQAVWLAVPIIFTPPWLLDLLPTIAGPKSYATWHLQTLVRYPTGFAFTTTVLYLLGALLQSVWLLAFWPGVAVGSLLGLSIGGLWFLVTGGHSYGWFALGIVGALLSALLHPKRPPLTFRST